MPKCTYCSKMYDTHKGVTFVDNKGNINYFCSSKCQKSKKMKKRKVRWILKAKKKSKQEIQKEVLARSEEAAEHTVDKSKPKK